MTATFSLLALTAGLFLHSTEIQVPRAVQKPVLDGKISPGEWPGPLTEDFYLFAKANAEKSPRKVQLRMQYDPENIYICLYCNDPRIPDSSGPLLFPQAWAATVPCSCSPAYILPPQAIDAPSNN